jgi:paraquat-inducible protein B
MRRARDATSIGIFVLGAIALMIVAVVLWGSGRLFRETERYVCYFEGSVEGLEVGAAVKARGVTVGRVVRIQLRYRQRPDDDRVPVFVELDSKRTVGLGAQRLGPHSFDPLIARGLRARLEMVSLVTGTLFVNFQQFPETPVRYSEIDPEHGYPEIPTAPRQLTQLSESVTAILSKLGNTDFPGMVKAITDAAASAGRLTDEGQLPAALAELKSAMSSYKKLGDSMDAEMKPLLADLRGAVSDARKAFLGLDSAAGATSRLIAPEAPLSVRLGDALKEVTRAAASVRELADYLQRNPNSLLRGKPK